MALIWHLGRILLKEEAKMLEVSQQLDKVSYEFEQFQFVQVLRVLQSYSSGVICK